VIPVRNTLVALLAVAALAGAEGRVVVYVSVDQEHSAVVLDAFRKETGIEVVAEYDTEATKTVGHVGRLLAERGRPQADVFWNNEIATTVKLKRSGVLERYVSPSAADIPDEFKDADGMWTGFAARARVLIVNTDLVPEADRPTSIWDLTKERWRGRVGMAKPETGTTATHAACLYVKDREMADRFFDALIGNDVVWRTGNAHVMKDVREGRLAFGLTDTDDVHVARRLGAPVAQVYPDAEPGGLGTLYLPNTVMLVKGGPNPAAGQRLVDWLLRPETERRLAEGDSAQIPVRPGVPVPPHVRRPDEVGTRFLVDFESAGSEYDRWVQHVREKIGAGQRSAPTLFWILAGVVALGAIGFALLKRATSEPT